MQFKHPELLYALLLLVIPLLVHLFQLRRFKTEKFTNVRFLKKAILQTRKSSRLKKWLILATRLLLLASIIIAFAQPFYPPASGEVTAQETLVYLDNSYSMQAKGRYGVLLKRAVQDLLENLPTDGKFTLFTNDEEFINVEAESLRKKLQELQYSATQLPPDIINLKAQNLFSNTPEVQKNFIAISDFQEENHQDSLGLIPNVNSYFVQLEPETRANIAIDTAFISSRNLDETTLEVEVKAFGNPQKEVSVGLYNKNNLLARKTVELNEGLKAQVSFTFPTQPIQNGSIRIEDNALMFDNELLFSIDETPPIQVVAIGNADSSFLRRIYTSPEFNLNIFTEGNIDYNLLSQANLVILNELENIPFALSNTIQKLQNEGTFLIVVPSVTVNLQNYNTFFQNLNLPSFGQRIEQERLITQISYEHPLYASVFDEKVENFQYPLVRAYYLPGRRETPVLRFANGNPFLFEKGNSYVFTAALDEENSNFKNAPLIVPTFYNIGNQAISPTQLYYNLGKDKQISVQVELDNDEILKLSSEEHSFIPRQQSFQNKVTVYLEGNPTEIGHYAVLKDSLRLRTLSFNVNRNESNLSYRELKSAEGIVVSQSIPNVFDEIRNATEAHSLWKWFVIFALFFFLTEMLILKFLK